MTAIPLRVPQVSLSEEDSSRLATTGRWICAFLAHHVGRPVTRSTRPRSITAIATVDSFRFEIAATVASTLRRRPVGEDIADWIARREAAPHELVVDVLVSEEWLVDGSLATLGNFGFEFCNPEFPRVEDAIAWVEAYCRRVAVPRLTAAEERAWNWDTVTVPDEDRPNKQRDILLIEAVDVYGSKYRDRISVPVLVDVHGLSEKDAEIVVGAVRKFLPRRRT